jgi:hypothetical protein
MLMALFFRSLPNTVSPDREALLVLGELEPLAHKALQVSPVPLEHLRAVLGSLVLRVRPDLRVLKVLRESQVRLDLEPRVFREVPVLPAQLDLQGQPAELVLKVHKDLLASLAHRELVDQAQDRKVHQELLELLAQSAQQVRLELQVRRVRKEQQDPLDPVATQVRLALQALKAGKAHQA